MTFDTYNNAMYNFIVDYTLKEKVPPTVDTIRDTIPGIKSKSTIYQRLQYLVEEGLLEQKNIKGYYYPTCLEVRMKKSKGNKKNVV